MRLGGYVVRIGTATWEPAINTDAAALWARCQAAETSPCAARCHRCCPDDECVQQHYRAATPSAASSRSSRWAFAAGPWQLCAGRSAAIGPHRRGDVFNSLRARRRVWQRLRQCRATGTAAQDGYGLHGDDIVNDGRHSGGLEGGVTTGAPRWLRVACKPIATTLLPQASVDLASGQPAPTCSTSAAISSRTARCAYC